MRPFLFLCVVAVALTGILSGCAASNEPSTTPSTQASAPEATTAPTAPVPSVSRPAPVRTTPQDTVSVAVQQTQKPAYEAAEPVKPAVTTPSTPTSGAPARYGVQIGAYKLQENADGVAATAKLRFARTITTMRDDATGLIKVVIGDFTTKEEARAFRDRMVQQYPGDYKDAWVSDIAK